MSKQSRYVTLGENAQVFHDQTTGITIVKGQVKELSLGQISKKKIKMALSGGHLAYCEAPSKDDAKKDLAPKLDKEALKEKFEKLYLEGLESIKTKDAFTLAELKALAEIYEIEVEADDTKQTITDAIYETLKEE